MSTRVTRPPLVQDMIDSLKKDIPDAEITSYRRLRDHRKPHSGWVWFAKLKSKTVTHYMLIQALKKSGATLSSGGFTTYGCDFTIKLGYVVYGV